MTALDGIWLSRALPMLLIRKKEVPYAEESH
jgi:hypothetical protein